MRLLRAIWVFIQKRRIQKLIKQYESIFTTTPEQVHNLRMVAKSNVEYALQSKNRNEVLATIISQLQEVVKKAKTV